MLTLQSRAIDQCTKAVKADKAGEARRALYYYKGSLVHLLEWLGMEKEVEAREALKARIRGYMARAEELKDALAAAAAAAGEESGMGAATITNTTSKGTSTDSRNSSTKKVDDKSSNSGSSSSSSSSGNNRTSASTPIASTEVGPQQDGTHIQEEEGEEEQDTDTCRRLLVEMPLVPVHGSDASLSFISSPGDDELREREAWLREWEAALVAKDLELQRRGREVRKREEQVEAWEKERKEEEEKRKKKEKENELEGVERDEAEVEGKNGEEAHA
jgi:hypothetical protein